MIGCLLLPFTTFGEQDDEEEETPAEQQSAKESQQSISIGGLDANPSKTRDLIKVIEEVTDVEVSPQTNVDSSIIPSEFSYDVDTDILTIQGSLETLKGEAITEANLLDKGIDDLMTRQTIPYLVDAYKFWEISGSPDSLRFNEILLEAVNLANILIRTLEMTNGLDVADSDNLFDKVKLTDTDPLTGITALLDNRNPYFHQLVRALASKGAFGDKSDDKVGTAIKTLISSLFPSGGNGEEISEMLSKTMRDIVFTDLQGDLGGLINLSQILPEENQKSSLFDIKVEQVKGIVAQDIILGTDELDENKDPINTTIDLTDQLKTKTNTPTKPEDWQVFGVGAGKDIIVKGNVSFKNSNNRDPQTDNVLRPQVKDHALAIGALDEIHFHSETIEKDWGLPADFLEKHLDYSGSTQTEDGDPAKFYDRRTDRIKMDFDGANLYLGSISKMELVNVDLESGGNLGVASLDELHIVSSDPTDTPNTFTVGKNTNPSDRGDNVQLFANERIVADGLRFEGRVDSIYMEARTVDLKNVTFPLGSEVNLASDLGGVGANGTGNGKYPTFGIGQREIGRVNFIDQVKYDTHLIYDKDSFDTHPITISKR